MATAHNITFEADLLHDDAAAFGREWLVTNGLGGYASSSIGTANTRRYHGLLVAAMNPPLGRAVLLSKLEETLEIIIPSPYEGEGAGGEVEPPSPNEPERVTGRRAGACPPPIGGEVYPLSANLYPGTVYPQGHCSLESWSAYPAPTWVWSPAPNVRIEKQVWMPQGLNTVYVTYRLLSAPEGSTARLSLMPLLAWKDYHSEMKQAGKLDVAWAETTLHLTLPPIWKVCEESRPMTISLLREDGVHYPDADFSASGEWYYRFQHPREQERGLEYEEDLYTPGTFTVPLRVGETLVVVASVEETPDAPAHDAWNALIQRQEELLQKATASDGFAQKLILAADQFVVQVPAKRSTIIAGYPWFSDWGRDTMIALPGLCISTGRTDVAKEILLSFAAYVDQGMLPNRFPDAGEVPEYNTVDATLWYFAALHHYVTATGDTATLNNAFWKVLEFIVEYHMRGTRFNIHVDETDGLLHAGEPGVQLTWMDAKIGDWVVTPRIGKPVEINALWHNALRTMAHFAELLGKKRAATQYAKQAAQVAERFAERFARPDGRGLYDVLDTPHGDLDGSIRPNQTFAVSLPFAPIASDTPLARAIIETVQTELYTPCGMKTLSMNDPAYRPRYEGDPLSRDSAYHQGTAWPWLTGSFVEAHYKVYGNKDNARALLAPLEAQMEVFGIGSLAEVYDGSEPQRPNGCFAQAWSIAETLRVWKLLR